MRIFLRCSEELAKKFSVKPARALTQTAPDKAIYEHPDDTIGIVAGQTVLIWPLIPDDETTS